MNPTLSGKLCVISGASSGIGRATAAAFVRAGATVCGTGRDEARLAAVAAELGPAFLPLRVDLSDGAQRQRVAEWVRRCDAPLYAFVSNAAECRYGSPLSESVTDIARLFEVNVLAAVALCQALVPLMAPGSQLVHVSSVTARYFPNSKFGPYAASKVAAETIFEALRLELHPKGIRVSLVLPGLVNTPIYDKVSGFEAARKKLEEQIPEWLEPADVADAVLWLLTRPPHVAVTEITLLPQRQTR